LGSLGLLQISADLNLKLVSVPVRRKTLLAAVIVRFPPYNV
jgi:hypothetical protein